MTSSEHLTCFMNELETEKNVLCAFIEILKKEEHALINGKTDEVDYLTSDKSRLIEKLIQLDDKRNEFLKLQGLSLEKNSVNAWLIEQCSDQPKIKILWNELLELAKIIQKLNHTNGLIISSHWQYHQRAFAALHRAAGNVSLYGPEGQQTYL